ncbi:hypothetical protein AC579_2636 [Pseudocercospora musae]|uniref:SH3 domain-containing protein n=1 Tax=Pseudocercospora musae TaxID=113226 RepID=A0A139IGS8_9PEZI|nr:hypothetical protein AC579_2636 [Pseudocercospora musae]
MVLHKRHTHGRVFRGQDARDLLALRKRYFNSDNVRMHVPEGWDTSQKQVLDTTETSDDSSDTLQHAVSVVYVTLPQTFSGPAMYSTLTGTPTDGIAAATPTATQSVNYQASYDAAKSSAQAGRTTASDASTATVMPTSAQTTFQTAQVSRMGGTPIQATHSASATASGTPDESNSGMTGGAKAGLAFGIILAIGLVVGLVLFCLKRKKAAQKQGQMLDEKHGSFADVRARGVEAGGMSATAAGGAAAGARPSSTQTEKVPASLRSTRTASTAPRLSLRPVTQFLPNLADNRKSTNNNLHVADAAEKSTSAWERNPSGQNPFDDATMLSEKQAQPDSPPSNPFAEPERKSNESNGAAVGAAAAAAASKHSPKSSWEGSEPATPRNAQFGTAAAVAIGGPANGPVGPRQPNNVHRVQLDFKPSMDDELELRSGQLVRMLHEYDDGWALCIRMDRSQQGVAPRTCLSKVPVKPRPQGSPPQGAGPNPRGPPPGARRPAGANGPPSAMVPRPLTPAQSSRSPSPSDKSSEASTTAAGTPAVTRKPVPGQAM